MPKHEPERRCIISGEREGRDALLRLALSPDGEVLPDIGARAPGRGAWVKPDHALVAEAEAKGKLRGALQRAFKGDVKHVPEGMAARIEAGLKRAALDRLGLELRSGNLLLGSDRIAAAVDSGEARLVLHAADAAPDGVRKLAQRLHSAGGKAKAIALPAGRDELSLALGQANVVHAALRDRQAALRVESAVGRWRAYLGLHDGIENADGAPSAGLGL
ncbi:DUF448 domain-containing protein [Sphingosinicella soli]|uniref:YlxR domain-containing protein n=1 Tax=Sphingosinicella soli TaxID=333708 RepID=A0A7W7F6F9_9SPHN|nr:DUF448 domain-containing protein [Sphingosinicella soli]MBB4631537.1 hypothetical protein [Sphingosinicella soli]